METLGEFGVFFILFAVGLEFSPDRIKKVKLLTVFYALFHVHTFSFCLLNTIIVLLANHLQCDAPYCGHPTNIFYKLANQGTRI